MLLFLLPLLFALPTGWNLVSNKDGIETARKTVPNSDLFAFRGETVTDIPVATLASLILDDPKGVDWVELMNLSVMIERKSPTTKIIHQGYDLPWPIQDRDYVMEQTAKFDQEQKVCTILFASVLHPKMPKQNCCIRAQTYRTYWKLTALPNGKSKAEVEVYTDPKGSLPSWLINWIQEDWPYNTLTGLLLRIKKGDITPHPEALDWN